MNFISNPTVIIPDVSFWQDDNTTSRKIDFVKMKAAGAVGVIIRAGQNSWPDPDFADYWIAAKAAGLLRGTYWFYDSRSTPQSQVNIWKGLVGTDYPELGFYADLEESYGGAYKGEANWKAFMNALDVAFPQKRKSIYTANWWWSQQVVNDVAFWSKYPLWVAGYTTNPANVVLPKPWTSAKLWQYTDKGNGTIYGVESLNIDLSYYNGTLEQFNLEFGVTVPPPPAAHVPSIEQWNELNSKVDKILVEVLKLGTPTTPPPPVNDLLDYTGPYAGEYIVKDNGDSVKWFGVNDSYDRDTTQMNYETSKWYQDSDPESWKWFVNAGVLTQNESGLWFTKLRLYRGQKVRIGEINKTKNTGRVIGFMLSDNQPTTICVHSPQKVDWLRAKVQGQPVYYYYIQPWRTPKDTVPNALWVNMDELERIT